MVIWSVPHLLYLPVNAFSQLLGREEVKFYDEATRQFSAQDRQKLVPQPQNSVIRPNPLMRTSRADHADHPSCV